MFDWLLPYVGLILDGGNVVFFIANCPQLITAYKNRRNLAGLSSRMLFGFIISTILFIIVGLITNGVLTVTLGMANIIFFALQLYWKRKYSKTSSSNRFLDEAIEIEINRNRKGE